MDYHFDVDNDGDKEYIESNRYSDDYIEHEKFILKKVGALFVQDEDWEKIEKFLNKDTS